MAAFQVFMYGRFWVFTEVGIRELGYSPRPTNRAAKRQSGEDGDRSCLEILMDSVKEATYLRLFLNSDYSKDAMARIFDELKHQPSTGSVGDERITAAIFAIAEKIKKQFPVTFTIEDACLTNSDAIWLAKHTYL